MSQADDFVVQDGVLLEYRGISGTVAVPKGVIGIPSNVFRGSDVEEVVLPEGLEWLGDFAFSECQCLRRLVLPGTLRVVPDCLCWHSQALEEVVIPEGVVFLDHAAFSETGLRSVTIPGSVRSIGFSCFASCEQLETVTLEEGVRTLGPVAFCSCASLTSISFPDSLQAIRSFAFEDCHRLTSLRMGRELERVGNGVFRSCGLLRSVEFPESLESIAPDAFTSCSSLEGITFRGNRVNSISLVHSPFHHSPLAPVIRAPRLRPQWVPLHSRPAALKGWREMKKEGWPLDPEIVNAWEAIPIGPDPDSSRKPPELFRVLDGVLCKTRCVRGRVVVPDGVVGIRAEVFRKKPIRDLFLPDSVQWIQAGAFWDCKYLETVRLPAGLTRISEHLFQNCRSLKYIRIPDSVKVLEMSAFEKSGLEAIELPSSLETIGVCAFSRCRRLKQVRFSEGLRKIQSGAFNFCSSLAEVRLPDSLLILEDDSFSCCTNLERVALGAGLRYQECGTFRDCDRLREVSGSANSFFFRKRSIFPHDSPLRFRLKAVFLELECPDDPLQIIAPDANPTILDEGSLRPLLLGFVSEDGRGFRYGAEYVELLRSRRQFWDSEEIPRFLLRHDLLEREDIPGGLEALQEKPALVAEVLEYCHRRFPEPAEPLYLD